MIFCFHEVVLRLSSDMTPLQPILCPHCQKLDVGSLLPPGPLRQFLFEPDRVVPLMGYLNARTFCELLVGHCSQQLAQMVGWAMVLAIQHQSTAPTPRGMIEEILRGSRTEIRIRRDPLRIIVCSPPALDAREMQRFLSQIGVLHHSRFEELPNVIWCAQDSVLVMTSPGGAA